MANVIINDAYLYDIADAIREKWGIEDSGVKFMPIQMAYEIRNIPSGGGEIEVEPIVLTGDCQYACGGAIAANYIKMFGDTISTKDISVASYMFRGYTGDTIPFSLNFIKNSSTPLSFNGMFQNSNIRELPTFGDNVSPANVGYLISGCEYLRTLEGKVEHWDLSKLNSGSTASYSSSNMFNNCYSLRKIPAEWLKKLYSENKSSSYVFYNKAFYQCYSLDEIIGIPIQNATLTSNTFTNTFYGVTRAKDIIFDTNDDGTPKTANWKSQTITLNSRFGSTAVTSYITDYNSGITTSTKITSDATYLALKDNPDSWTSSNAYSRYNHDSAVRTINSLPDTSAYLASAGGTNTIKFNGALGSSTDGGAINTLTAEEIAVATAKGWTVTM